MSKQDRRFVVVSGDCFQRLASRATDEGIPVTMALAEILDNWEPTQEDAARARGEGKATLWIDADLHERLGRVAHLRGVTIRALVDQALESIP